MGRKPNQNLSPQVLKLVRRIGTNVKQLREDAELSLVELSERSGVATTTINEMESRPSRDIRLSTLIALAEALEVPLIKLFGETNLKIQTDDKQTLLRVSEDLNSIIRRIQKEEK